MKDIRESYSEFLQRYHWDYFFTTTFRSPRREPYYAMKNVYTTLKRHNVGRAFIGVEPHSSGDLHCHGVMAGYPPEWKPEIDLPWNIWTSLHRRFGRSKVEACNSQAKVSSYCSKYILKAQSSALDHYGLFGTKTAWTLI